MTTTPATPTDAERRAAMECVTYDLGASMDRVAQALADQRARYEAVADVLDAEAHGGRGKHFGPANSARHDAAERIRQVASA